MNIEQTKIEEPTTSIQQQKRDSNMELLRIVCMLGVILNHFMGVHTGGHHAINCLWMECVHSLTYVAVPCFVMISGFYGIKFRLKSFLNLYLTCFFYGLFCYFVHIWYSGDHIGRWMICQSLLIFSHSDWWFIYCYVGLFLLSPILNAAIERFNKKQHLIALIAVWLLQIYFGWGWHVDFVEKDGFGILCFVCYYVLGAFVRKYIPVRCLIDKKYRLLIAYLLLSVLIVLADFFVKEKLSFYSFFSNYSSPLMMLSSLCFFCLFIPISFESKFVNKVAKSSLSGYLVQESSYIGWVFLYPLVSSVYDKIEYAVLPLWQPLLELVIALGASILLFAACFVLDQLRILFVRLLLDNNLAKRIFCLEQKFWA